MAINDIGFVELSNGEKNVHDLRYKFALGDTYEIKIYTNCDTPDAKAIVALRDPFDGIIDSREIEVLESSDEYSITAIEKCSLEGDGYSLRMTANTINGGKIRFKLKLIDAR